MRADRLLSLLMLLQTRGRMTARALSDELEVSERTIYRDLDALSQAGVPVYADRGPGGGCALLDSYRSSLTGLTQPEVRALLMLSIPGPLADLGLGQELKGALLKLSAAHPDRADQFRGRLYLDWSGGSHPGQPAPFLKLLRQAAWDDRRVWLAYQTWQGFRVETEVSAYGLVSQVGVWFLAAARGVAVRIYPVADLLEVRLLEDCFQRPPGFDMETFWKAWCAEQLRSRPVYRVVVQAEASLLPFLKRVFSGQVRAVSPAAHPGKLSLDLQFDTYENARQAVLGLGRAVEVLEPEPLRRGVIDFAEQVLSVYRS